jgi:hypothetical protein
MPRTEQIIPKAMPEHVPLPDPIPSGRPVVPDSFAQQIARLEVGDTASRAQRMPAATTTYPVILEAKAKMRNVIGSQVKNVKDKPECEGRLFTTAIGNFNSPDGDTLVVVTVTRTH